MGTTLKLYFPSVRESASGSAPSGAGSAERRAASGRILIVEDDPLVREMARRSLSEAGYEVMEAANGQTALDLVSRGLAESMRCSPTSQCRAWADESWRGDCGRAGPALPVVFMSGYTDDVVIRRGLLESGVPFLEKPLSPVELARKMRQVLNGGML